MYSIVSIHHKPMTPTKFVSPKGMIVHTHSPWKTTFLIQSSFIALYRASRQQAERQPPNCEVIFCSVYSHAMKKGHCHAEIGNILDDALFDGQVVMWNNCMTYMYIYMYICTFSKFKVFQVVGLCIYRQAKPVNINPSRQKRSKSGLSVNSNRPNSKVNLKATVSAFLDPIMMQTS